MKKLLAMLFGLATLALPQSSVTPNLNLVLPPTGTLNWGPTNNANFQKIDAAIGALQSAFQGNWQSGTSYLKGQSVTYLGGFYISLTNLNSGNNPSTDLTHWSNIYSAVMRYLPSNPTGTCDRTYAVISNATATPTLWGCGTDNAWHVSAGGSGVTSVFGRTSSAITAQSSDYSSFYDALGAAAAVTATRGATNGLAPLDASQLLPLANIPAGIDAAKIGAGDVTTSEFSFINSLTSNAQNQFNTLTTNVGTKLGATSGSAIQKANGAGGLTSAIAGTDYTTPPSGSAIQKANGAGGLVPAVPGTDYQVPIAYTTENAANKDASSGYAGLTSSSLLKLAEFPTGIPAANIGTGVVGNTQYAYLANVTSDIQAQISAKSGQPINPVTPNLLAEYPVNALSGTSLADISGNANNGTFGAGAAAPVWSSWGLTFNHTLNSGNGNYIALPSALNAWRTAAFYLCPAAGPQNTNTAATVTWDLSPAILGTSNGTGFGIVGGKYIGTSLFGAYDGGFTPTGFNLTANSANTGSQDGFGGCSILVYARDASTDHVYINGKEVNYAIQGGSSGIAATTGATWIGSIAGGSFGGATSFTGDLGYAMFWSTELTSSQAQQITNYIASTVVLRPALPIVRTNYSTTDQLIAVGDSLTAGYGAVAATPWTSSLTLNGTYNVTNWGMYGMNASGMRILAPIRQFTQVSPGARNTIVHWAGMNDIYVNNFTAAQAWANLKAAASQDITLGARPVLVSTIARTGGDTLKDSLNALERANWKAAGFAGFVDAGGSTTIGKDGASSNTTYFQTDAINLKTAGQTLVAGWVSNVINQLDGATESAHHVTAATTYTATWADAGSLDLNPTSNNVAVTLPDCMAMTGSQMRFYNIATSGSFSATITPVNSETINGSTSAFTIPLSNTKTLFVNYSGDASGGCVWSTTSNSATGGGLADPGANGPIYRTGLNTTRAGVSDSDYASPFGWNVQVAGAKGDGQFIQTGSMTSGSASLTVGTGVFVGADIGKTIVVYGAGASGAILKTTISAFTSATQVTLAANAATTVTSTAPVYWGTIDSAVIASLAAAHPTSRIYLPKGNYFLDNSGGGSGVTLNNFNGLLDFAPDAHLICSNADSTAGWCFNYQTGTGAVINNIWVGFAYEGGLPLVRASSSNGAIQIANATHMIINHPHVDASAGLGLIAITSTDVKVYGAETNKTTADSVSFINTQDGFLNGFYGTNCGDDCLSILNYSAYANNTGFSGSNIRVYSGAARGITVVGQANVNISNFYVKSSAYDGVFVLRDTGFATRKPTNVTFANGIIDTPGTAGIEYYDADNLSFSNIQIFNPGTYGKVSGLNGTAITNTSLSNILVQNANNGPCFYTTYETRSNNQGLNCDGAGYAGFYIAHSSDVRYSNITMRDVAKSDSNHYLWQIENNSGPNYVNNVHATDDNATAATGYVIEDYSNGTNGVYVTDFDYYALHGTLAFSSTSTNVTYRPLNLSHLFTVTYGATPVFDFSQGGTAVITLTGSNTSSTVVGMVPGNTYTVRVCLDATAGRPFVWPVGLVGHFTIGSTASKCNVQPFIALTSTTANATGGGQINQ